MNWIKDLDTEANQTLYHSTKYFHPSSESEKSHES